MVMKHLPVSFVRLFFRGRLLSRSDGLRSFGRARSATELTSRLPISAEANDRRKV